MSVVQSSRATSFVKTAFILNHLKSTPMPSKIVKTNGKYKVSTPSGTKAKGTTLKKAKAQKRLLNAIDHGYKPKK